MARPLRNANSDHILSPSRTFFVTTKTSMGRALLQSERNAMLLIEVLRSYVAARKFRLHDFVVMPDHVHMLITVDSDMTIERAMQFIKGGFSYRLRKEVRLFGRGMAARIFRSAGRRPGELLATSRIYRSESREGGAGGFAGEVPLLLYLFGKTKSSRG